MRVAVLGAGYAGLLVARTLEDTLPESAELVVVDEDDYHLVQHELHRVVRRPGFAEEIAIPLADLLDDATLRRARVEAVDPAARSVALADGETLSYDVAAVCLGATTNFADLPGVEAHATPLKRLADARAIREEFLDVLDVPDLADESSPAPATPRGASGPSAGSQETGDEGPEPAVDEGEPTADEGEPTADGEGAPTGVPESTPDEPSATTQSESREEGKSAALDETDRPTVVVGGAGLSGIQVAGELVALAREVGAADHVGVLLLEQEDAVAPGFPADFQSAVRTELATRGVVVRTGAPVRRATADAVHLAGGERIPYSQFVWTGGIRGPDALDGARPVVRGTLAFDDHTFVLGDAARVVDAEGESVPASAQAAVGEARTAATNVLRIVESDLEGEVFRPRLEQFRFDSRGWLVSVGDGAVAQVGPSVFRGRAARALKSSVGVGYLASAGAIREALDVVREEFRPEDDGPEDDGPENDGAME